VRRLTKLSASDRIARSLSRESPRVSIGYAGLSDNPFVTSWKERTATSQGKGFGAPSSRFYCLAEIRAGLSELREADGKRNDAERQEPGGYLSASFTGVIPRSTGYRLPGQMSACFSAFRRQLPGGGYGAPADALGPIAILEEVMLQARAGSINKADAASLKHDVRSALGELGPLTKDAVGQGLDLFLKTMGELRPRIEDHTDSGLLRKEVSLLLRSLSRTSVREAAFEDAWRSFRRTDRRAERCELRLLQLRELVEHADFEWKRVCERLDAILADYRGAIASLKPAIAAKGPETAGLSELERLKLCKEMVVGREPRHGDYAVWLVIDHPTMPEPWISLGPIDVFAGELWPSGLRLGGRLSELRPDFIAPPELGDDRGLQPGTDRLELPEVLLARVALTQAPPGSAARRARELLESAIDLANPESTWRLYEGEMVWHPDGGWSGSSLLAPDVAASLKGPVHPVFERTAEGLTELDPRWIEGLAGGDRASAEAVRDARLGITASGGRDPLLTVALGTRPLERMLHAFDPGSDDRAAVARAYLKPAWVKGTLYSELFESALGGIEVARLRGAGEELDGIESLLWRDGRAGERLFSLAGFAQAAEDLLRLVNDEGTIADRMLRRAASVIADPAAALRHVEALEGQFNRLLARSERQRNTTIHGHLPPPALVEAAAAFLESVGAHAARDLFRHDTGQDSMRLPLAREQTAFERARLALAAGDRLVSALFPEESVPAS
jgi:hypothetical protein